MYNAHPYFSLKNLGKTRTFYMAKYSILKSTYTPPRHSVPPFQLKMEGRAQTNMRTHVRTTQSTQTRVCIAQNMEHMCITQNMQTHTCITQNT